MMLQRSRVEMAKTGCRGVVSAIKTGGHYWRNLAYFLDERGIPFRFTNQFTLKRRDKEAKVHKQSPPIDTSQNSASIVSPWHSPFGKVNFNYTVLFDKEDDSASLLFKL